jgi:thiamine biosynthesis lipoprotein
MGMPITVEVIDSDATSIIDKVFDYFIYIDNKFSVYKKDSEIMKINRKEVLLENASADMQEIFRLAEQTKQETDGYFDIVNRSGIYDPSGIVKGWAIYKASKIIEQAGFGNYYIDAGGDIQVGGKNSENKQWKIGIKNPFKQEEIVKTVYLDNQGIATSGTYIRGQHIYNPKSKSENITEIVSLSVIGPNVYEADRFATAAFAMGKAGIHLIERIKGLEGYIIDSAGIATMTSGFEKYITIK